MTIKQADTSSAGITPNKFVTLVSEVSSFPSSTSILDLSLTSYSDIQDGYRFLVAHSTVMASPTIKTMLSMGEGGGFAEAESNTARLQIRGEVLEKAIEYLHFKTKYGASSDGEIPDFKNRIPPEIALELLMAADFLEREYNLIVTLDTIGDWNRLLTLMMLFASTNVLSVILIPHTRNTDCLKQIDKV